MKKKVMKKPIDVKLQEKFLNSKLDICKNFLYFIIAPLILMLVGIILISTVGFNLSNQLTGYSTFTIYVNNENNFGENIASYDLNNTKDYEKVKNLIEDTLSNQGIKISSYRTATMNIDDYLVINGQAVQVDFANTLGKDKINEQNQTLKDSLLVAFGYNDYTQAVSDIDYIQPIQTFDYVIALLAGIVFALVASMLYISLRYNKLAFIPMLMIVFLDLLTVLSLILICRIVVSLNIGVVLLTTLCLSLFNIFYLYSKLKYNIKTDKYSHTNLKDIVNSTSKEIFIKKSIIYIWLILFFIIFIAISVPGVRYVALGILISLIVTLYNSSFVLPSIVATIYKTNNKKKLI